MHGRPDSCEDYHVDDCNLMKLKYRGVQRPRFGTAEDHPEWNIRSVPYNILSKPGNDVRLLVHAARKNAFELTGARSVYRDYSSAACE